MQVSFSCCDLEIIVTSHSGQVGQACCCAEGAWWVVAPELRGVIFTNAKSSARRPVTCVFICYLSSGGPFRTFQRDVIIGEPCSHVATHPAVSRGADYSCENKRQLM